MTHEELSRFPKYRNAAPASQALARELISYVRDKYQLEPTATPNAYLRYDPNFLLIQTIHQRQASLTINVFGPPADYEDLSATAVRVTGAQNGYTRLFIAGPAAIPAALTAVNRSWHRRSRAR